MDTYVQKYVRPVAQAMATSTNQAKMAIYVRKALFERRYGRGPKKIPGGEHQAS